MRINSDPAAQTLSISTQSTHSVLLVAQFDIYVPQLEIQQSVSYFQIWTFMVHRGAFSANTALSHPPCCEAPV